MLQSGPEETQFHKSVASRAHRTLHRDQNRADQATIDAIIKMATSTSSQARNLKTRTSRDKVPVMRAPQWALTHADFSGNSTLDELKERREELRK
jgi:hypothetical protein